MRWGHVLGRAAVGTAFLIASLPGSAGARPAGTAEPHRTRQGAPAPDVERCGDHRWCDPSLEPGKRADLLIEALTPAERITLLGGDDDKGAIGLAHTHTGTWYGVPRLDVPAFFQTDGPLGVRQGQGTALPASISVAASFDRTIAREQGVTVAREAKAKGDDLVYGPTVNILRTPLWGRAFETYGEDPYLTGQMAVPWIQGLQGEGVLADVKHFAVNNQEGAAGTGEELIGGRGTVDAEVDERALREIYLPQFETAIRDGKAATVMCAYNELNGTHACENRELLTQILRKEWGFDGFVLADYGASKHIDTGLRAGLDYEPFPFIDAEGGENFTPTQIQAALDDGRIEQADVDRALRRILVVLFRTGFFDRPAYRDAPDSIDRVADRDTARKAAEAGIVLLRNQPSDPAEPKGPRVLPLDDTKVHALAVIGADADQYVRGGGSSAMKPYDPVTVLDALSDRAGQQIPIVYDDGTDIDRAARTASAADAVVVVASASATEGIDRGCLALDCTTDGSIGHRDALIEAVGKATAGKAVVVLQTAAPVLTPWRNEVGAILEAWYPGETAGEAITAVLFGDVDASGRLPATFPAAADDTAVAGDVEAYPGVDDVVRYEEGIEVGYRWYRGHDVKPAYPFGHGLSYTTFRFGRLTIEPSDTGLIATAEITNTGSRDGIAVPQLYVAMPSGKGHEQPSPQLKGFDRIPIPIGAEASVRFPLDARSFSYWDTAHHRWAVAAGCYRLQLATSVDEVQREAAVAVGEATCKDRVLELDTQLRPVVTPATSRPVAAPVARQAVGKQSPIIWLLMLGSGLVLLVAAALIARAARRSRTVATD